VKYIYNTIRCKISKLYDDDDVLYSLQSTPSPLSLPSSAGNGCTTQCLDGYHVDCADCCLIGIVLGVTMKKISPNSNTTQYLQILPSTQLPNASIVLTLSGIYGINDSYCMDTVG